MQNMQCGILLKVQGERLLTEEYVGIPIEDVNDILEIINPELL